MNEHLRSVFKMLLPELEKSGVDYWVYGGVGVAAYAGKFFRRNDDVDAFVKDSDFDRAKSILRKMLGTQNSIYLKECNLLKRGKFDRPKFELRIGKEEIMSVVPVFQVNNTATLVFGNGPQELSSEILKKVERNLSGYRFFTSENQYIKETFIKCLPARINGRSRENVQKDAKMILGPNEYAVYYPSQ